MSIRTYGRQRVELENLDKVLFPAMGIKKRDLVDYYERVSDWMVPHMKDRPLSLERWPDGIAGESFDEKLAPDYIPDWIATADVPLRGGGSQSEVVCDRTETLVYLANRACVTPHVWSSRSDRLEVPDRMVFDLDPPTDDFGLVRIAAQAVRDALERVGLPSFVMLTGSRGAHVVVPLRRKAGFDRVRSLARAIAEGIARDRPEELTTAERKDMRGGRLLLDTTRNAFGQTTVAPYAVRTRPGAPVATPIGWDELPGVTSTRYDIRNLFHRLARKRDPWRDIGRRAQTLEEAEARLRVA